MLNDEEKGALNLFKGSTLTYVQNVVQSCPVETEEQRRHFKRAFALFIQKSFLCPTFAPNISPIHLPVIRDIDNTHKRNWAHHVNSFLINGINEFKEKKRQTVKGCHLVLMIIYFKERYNGKSLNDPNAPTPWIQRWSGDMLREKIRTEADDVIGLIQRAKMRAQREKGEKKKSKGNGKEEEHDSESIEFDTKVESEEETEYEDQETDPEAETNT
ncbi:hypothetical protein PIB30_090813, partial [Stylosanthes scabra]|nr:hypothetical protein [Stylosanthes scabra]